MPKHLELTGQRIGHVTVVKYIGIDSRASSVWECRCDCGRRFYKSGVYLARKYPDQSCGCLTRPYISKAMTRHGHEGKRTYSSWHGMKTRCLNPRSASYYNYGGRGIRVCERWLKFENFLADMGERPPNMTLERKDYNGHYEPSNCVWADDATQRRNKRNTRMITINGESKCIAEWAKIAGLTPENIWYRIKYGWTGPDLLLPVRPLNRAVK